MRVALHQGQGHFLKPPAMPGATYSAIGFDVRCMRGHRVADQLRVAPPAGILPTARRTSSGCGAGSCPMCPG